MDWSVLIAFSRRGRFINTGYADVDVKDLGPFIDLVQGKLGTHNPCPRP